jgi:hypothetical protein
MYGPAGREFVAERQPARAEVSHDAEPVGRAARVVTSTTAIDSGRLDAVGPEDD